MSLASVKYRLLKKDTLGYITQSESKFFDGLLLAYGVLCLEHRNTFSIPLYPIRTGASMLLT